MYTATRLATTFYVNRFLKANVFYHITFTLWGRGQIVFLIYWDIINSIIDKERRVKRQRKHSMDILEKLEEARKNKHLFLEQTGMSQR